MAKTKTNIMYSPRRAGDKAGRDYYLGPRDFTKGPDLQNAPGEKPLQRLEPRDRPYSND